MTVPDRDDGVDRDGAPAEPPWPSLRRCRSPDRPLLRHEDRRPRCPSTRCVRHGRQCPSTGTAVIVEGEKGELPILDRGKRVRTGVTAARDIATNPTGGTVSASCEPAGCGPRPVSRAQHAEAGGRPRAEELVHATAPIVFVLRDRRLPDTRVKTVPDGDVAWAAARPGSGVDLLRGDVDRIVAARAAYRDLGWVLAGPAQQIRRSGTTDDEEMVQWRGWE